MYLSLEWRVSQQLAKLKTCYLGFQTLIDNLHL